MTQQLKKTEGAREDFRSKFTADNVARVKQDPNYNYKLVIYNYPKMPHNFDHHEKNGYEVVYSMDSIEDDRKFSPDNKDEEKLRPSPVTKRTVDGYEQVLMRILKTKERANKIKASQEDQAKYVRSSKSRVSKKQNVITIDGGEVTNSNNEENNNE